jgi:hypothetical protein
MGARDKVTGAVFISLRAARQPIARVAAHDVQLDPHSPQPKSKTSLSRSAPFRSKSGKNSKKGPKCSLSESACGNGLTSPCVAKLSAEYPPAPPKFVFCA